MAAVIAPRRNPSLSLEDLRQAAAKVDTPGLKVFTSEDRASGAAIKTPHGESLVFVYAVLRHDKRVKLTFSRQDNPFQDAVVNFQTFDKNAAFAAAIRIFVGNHDPRFRNKAAVAALVDRDGVPEVAKAMPRVFSDFMFATLHVFNCKLGVDRSGALNKLREQIRLLVPHLSEEEVVCIYREEVVDWVNNS
jgi:hypothetical protein